MTEERTLHERADIGALVEYFRHEEPAEGERGDYDHLETVDTAIRLLRERKRRVTVLESTTGYLAETAVATDASRDVELETLRQALERALTLAEKWRDVTDETLGRLTTGGSAELDFMHDEMDDLRKLLAGRAVSLPAAQVCVTCGHTLEQHDPHHENLVSCAECDMESPGPEMVHPFVVAAAPQTEEKP